MKSKASFFIMCFVFFTTLRLYALCDPVVKAAFKVDFLSFLDEKQIQRPKRNLVGLTSYDRKTSLALSKFLDFFQNSDNVASLSMLKSRKFLAETGIEVNSTNPIELTQGEISKYQTLLRQKKYAEAYHVYFKEQLYSMGNMPRFDSEEVSINLPDFILVLSDNQRVPINKAYEQGLISKEVRDFVVDLEMLTRLEELFHAADHSRHSLTGRSVSETFNELLDWIDVEFSYSDMTETSFAFFLKEVEPEIFKKIPELWKVFVETYKSRGILLHPEIDEIQAIVNRHADALD